ncbi:hypothetical protein [Nonomuraea sp. LPB2021202275-12-8]|uniref:hypothetical protein n=1 Tax=Nonomuraea sp. LPB2021202275-12-8 TaxID=3120159 RepID=UPI00300C2FBC
MTATERITVRPRTVPAGRARVEEAARLLAGLAGRLRHGRALHPRGLVVAATLQVRGGSRRPLGLPVLDEPGEHEVIARLSKGGSLPGSLPDVLGLAVRLPGPVDLLLSTCGPLPWMLLPRTGFTAGPYSSLARYDSGTGSVRLIAWPEGMRVPADPRLLPQALAREPLLFHLRAAPKGGPVTAVATLRVHTALPDEDVAFDPVLNSHPALRQKPWLARLRRGAYLGSRQVRGAKVERGPAS